MRTLIIFLIAFLSLNAFDSLTYFKQSEDNKLLCHVGQRSFKMISQKNAEIIKVHDHVYFKLRNENLYFLSNACQSFEPNHQGIIF